MANRALWQDIDPDCALGWRLLIYLVPVGLWAVIFAGYALLWGKWESGMSLADRLSRISVSPPYTQHDADDE